jgi:transposase-like protein
VSGVGRGSEEQATDDGRKTRYRTYTIEFERQLVEEHLSGGVGLGELARRHDLSRALLRTWVRKRVHSALGYLSPARFEEIHAREAA